MTEKKAKNAQGPVRIPDDVLDEIRAEQYRIRSIRPKVKVPTLGELAAAAWKAFKSGSRHESGTPQKGSSKAPIVLPSPEPPEWKAYRKTFSNPANMKLLQMLAAVLDSGDRYARHVITTAFEHAKDVAKPEDPEADSDSGGRRKK